MKAIVDLDHYNNKHVKELVMVIDFSKPSIIVITDLTQVLAKRF